MGDLWADTRMFGLPRKRAVKSFAVKTVSRLGLPDVLRIGNKSGRFLGDLLAQVDRVPFCIAVQPFHQVLVGPFP